MKINNKRHHNQRTQTYRTHHDEVVQNSTLGDIRDLKELSKKIYDDDEIKHFRMDEAIQHHPLASKPTNERSQLAYQQLLNELTPTSKYLLPGQIVCFNYLEPKTKEELEYYDKTPLTLFCGITRTNDGNIREVGFNLHYYPPYARARLLNTVYSVFKDYFDKQFNEDLHKPNMYINYNALMHLGKRSAKIGFGIKMYIPTLRSTSYVIPTRLIPTACYTEGHFSKATLGQIQHFWRKYH